MLLSIASAGKRNSGLPVRMCQYDQGGSRFGCKSMMEHKASRKLQHAQHLISKWLNHADKCTHWQSAKRFPISRTLSTDKLWPAKYLLASSITTGNSCSMARFCAAFGLVRTTMHSMLSTPKEYKKKAEHCSCKAETTGKSAEKIQDITVVSDSCSQSVCFWQNNDIEKEEDRNWSTQMVLRCAVQTKTRTKTSKRWHLTKTCHIGQCWPRRKRETATGKPSKSWYIFGKVWKHTAFLPTSWMSFGWTWTT